VADLLEEPRSPQSRATSGEIETLGQANLLGWWAYQILDERRDILPLATAFYATAVGLLAQLLPGKEALWQAFQRLSLTTAEALGRE
jgi:hypothetical protein